MGAFETLVQKATANGQTREQAIVDTMEFLGIHGSALELLAAEKSYEHAKTQWQSYCQWKKHRNKDRAKLEEKFGYDTKHASHLVRLLRTGNDLLKTGQLHVYRPDAEELLQIRNGHWSYDQLEEYAETVQQELHAFYDSGKSPLPKKPNINKIDELCIKLIEQSLSNNHK